MSNSRAARRRAARDAHRPPEPDGSILVHGEVEAGRVVLGTTFPLHVSPERSEALREFVVLYDFTSAGVTFVVDVPLPDPPPDADEVGALLDLAGECVHALDAEDLCYPTVVATLYTYRDDRPTWARLRITGPSTGKKVFPSPARAVS